MTHAKGPNARSNPQPWARIATCRRRRSARRSKGGETTVLAALGIAWRDGPPHICCPYADHRDDHPSWRWDQPKARAYCTCIERGGHSVFDVVMGVERSSSRPPKSGSRRSSAELI